MTSPTLHCYCCGTAYERGHFRCCKPPHNMASHVWLEMYCRNVGCNKCPNHCLCDNPKREREPVKPLSDFKRKFQSGEWTPYRDTE